MKAALDFWVRAHQDERHEPSGPRLGGFLLTIVLIIVVFSTLYAAFSGQKLASETGVKLVAGLGTVIGILYGASQLKGGLVGVFGVKPVSDGMPGQAVQQQVSLPQMPIISAPLRSLDLSAKTPQKPNISTVERWRERVARIIRVQDLVDTKLATRESLQKIHKPLSPDLAEKLALAEEKKPWKPRIEVTWRPQ
ncbi:MAG: hypothetical protein H6727_09320 [Myxococcales bacterium]|nr:hypothetical protein [Myxococcales bacterium]